MKHIKLFENFNEAQRSMSGAENVDHGTKVEVKNPGIKDSFEVFKRTKGGKTFYDFVQLNPEYYPGAEEDGDDEHAAPLVYTYSIDNGNITRGSGDRWSRQEVRSNSNAFNKGKEDKMSVPGDLEKAAEIIFKHYVQYVPKKKGEFESAAFPAWLYVPKKGEAKIAELQSDLKKAVTAERYEAAVKIKRSLLKLLNTK